MEKARSWLRGPRTLQPGLLKFIVLLAIVCSAKTVLADDILVPSAKARTEIEKVFQGDNNLAGVAVKQVATAPKLATLRLNNAKASDKDLEPLAKTNLVELGLKGTWVTDKGLDAVARIKSLKRIDLRNTRVSKNGVKRLMSLRPKIKVDLD